MGQPKRGMAGQGLRDPQELDGADLEFKKTYILHWPSSDKRDSLAGQVRAKKKTYTKLDLLSFLTQSRDTKNSKIHQSKIES